MRELCKAVEDSQSEELVDNFDVGLLVARLIASDGCADAAQLLIAILCCMRCCVAMADLHSEPTTSVITTREVSIPPDLYF